MKKSVVLLLVALLLLSACGTAPVASSNTGKPRIVASCFVAYDLVRALAGGAVEVSLLMPPGVDSHHFDPSLQDIAGIESADLFVYIGEASEPWVVKLLPSLGGDVERLALDNGISLSVTDQLGTRDDAHIWLNPQNAMTMIATLSGQLSLLCDDGAAVNKAAADLSARFSDLDNRLRALAVTQSKPLVFGCHYAAAHLMTHYGLQVITVYDSCEEESDPSAQALLEAVQAVKSQGLGVVYGEENSQNKVARSMADETGAQLLIFYAAHTVTAQQLDDGVSLLSLMELNYQNMKAGLDS